MSPIRFATKTAPLAARSSYLSAAHHVGLRARRQPRLHPLMRDAGFISATSVILIVANPLIIALFARLLGAAALGEYLLTRRLANWGNALSQLGMGVALPRYVARAPYDHTADSETYFAVALISGGLFAGLIGLVLVVFRPLAAQQLFGSYALSRLVPPLALLLLGLIAQSMVYGYYQGRLRMGWASALQICNLAVVPLLAVVALHGFQSVGMIVSVIALAMLSSSAWLAGPALAGLKTTSLVAMRTHAAELLRFGIPRIPGDFALNALIAAGPVVAVHLVPMSQVSYLLVGISMVTVIEATASPISVIALSKASQMIAENRQDEITQAVTHLLNGIVGASLFACFQLEVFADVLIRVWVGHEFSASTATIRILLLAIPFDMVYVSMRSFIEASTITAFNVRNVLLCLVLFVSGLAVLLAFPPSKGMLNYIAAAYALSFVLLAALTIRCVRKLFDVTPQWREVAWPCLAAIVLGVGTAAIRWYTEFGSNLSTAIALEVGALAGYAYILKMLGSPWLDFGLSLIRHSAAAVRHGSDSGDGQR